MSSRSRRLVAFTLLLVPALALAAVDPWVPPPECENPQSFHARVLADYGFAAPSADVESCSPGRELAAEATEKKDTREYSEFLGLDFGQGGAVEADVFGGSGGGDLMGVSSVSSGGSISIGGRSGGGYSANLDVPRGSMEPGMPDWGGGPPVETGGPPQQPPIFDNKTPPTDPGPGTWTPTDPANPVVIEPPGNDGKKPRPLPYTDSDLLEVLNGMETVWGTRTYFAAWDLREYHPCSLPYDGWSGWWDNRWYYGWDCGYYNWNSNLFWEYMESEGIIYPLEDSKQWLDPAKNPSQERFRFQDYNLYSQMRWCSSLDRPASCVEGDWEPIQWDYRFNYGLYYRREGGAVSPWYGYPDRLYEVDLRGVRVSGEVTIPWAWNPWEGPPED